MEDLAKTFTQINIGPLGARLSEVRSGPGPAQFFRTWPWPSRAGPQSVWPWPWPSADPGQSGSGPGPIENFVDHSVILTGLVLSYSLPCYFKLCMSLRPLTYLKFILERS